MYSSLTMLNSILQYLCNYVTKKKIYVMKKINPYKFVVCTLTFLIRLKNVVGSFIRLILKWQSNKIYI